MVQERGEKPDSKRSKNDGRRVSSDERQKIVFHFSEIGDRASGIPFPAILNQNVKLSTFNLEF